MKRSNYISSKNKFFIFVLLLAVSSCNDKQLRNQNSSEKVFEKPFVADSTQPPVITMLDSCPPPKKIIVPFKSGESYTIKTDTGIRKIRLLPPGSKPADFNIPMQTYNVEDGLALSSVQASYCDNKGNLWFGTQGGGVSRYDGKSFTNFTTAQGLVDNQVFSIFQDKSGAMWFGTWNGVAKYDGKIFKSYSVKTGATCCVYHCISQDKKGNLWFGTGGGASKFDGKSFTNYLPENGLAGDEVYSMLQAKNGDIWFGTQSGISKYDGKVFQNFTTVQGLVNNYVTSIIEDNGGHIWFGTKGGISKYNGKEFQNFTVREGLIANNVTSLLQDENNHVWIGTWTGVSEYDGTSFKNYTVANGLVSNEIQSMVNDKNRNIWFSTDGNGICRYSGNAFTIYTKEQGLSSNTIPSILRDNKGMLWLGTYGYGAIQYDGKSFKSFTVEQGLASNWVPCIYQDKNNNLWFATTRGVSCYNGESFTNYTKEQGLADNTIWSIAEDNAGNIWFGTFGGGVSVLSEDKKTFTTYTTQQGLLDNNIHELLKDKKGNIWLSNDAGGFNKYNGKVFESFTEKQGIINGGGVGVFEDSNENLWFATGNGLSRYDGESFMNFNEDQGLPGDGVTDIGEDGKKRIWLGTNLGLIALKFKTKNAENSDKNEVEYINGDVSLSNIELKKNYEVILETFNFKNGYPVKDIAAFNSMYTDSNEVLWAGTGDKLVRLDYNKIYKLPNPPKVLIQRIKVNNENISWYDLDKKKVEADSNTIASNTIEETELFGRPLHDEQRAAMIKQFGTLKYDSIVPWYPIPVNLRLPYMHNSITFDFVAMESDRQAFIRFQYMLDGYDNDWNPSTEKTTANFGNIHEGDYTFKVKAQSSDGKWGEPTLYSFEVLPPWYRSWWAYASYILLFLIALWSFIKWRESALKKEKTLLEEKVVKRTHELKEEKEKVESTLTELKSTQAQLIQSEKMASLGELTAGIAHEIQNPLNFVNNFSEVNAELIEEAGLEIDNGNIIEVKTILNDIKENEQKINHHGKRADAIVKGMLQHSRSSNGAKEPTDINALADEYLRLSYHGVRAKDKSFNATLQTDFDETIGKVNIIPQDIGRVLLNLYNNAFYALAEKKKQGDKSYEPAVTICTKKIGDKVEVKVTDNGNGIPKKIVDKIFQPFFTTKPTGQGTGLGLSLSYDIVKAHGGELKVETKEGEGSAFATMLPA